MSEASRELEQKTGGDVPTADETIAATADEVAETVSSQRRDLKAGSGPRSDAQRFHCRRDRVCRSDPCETSLIAMRPPRATMP